MKSNNIISVFIAVVILGGLVPNQISAQKTLAKAEQYKSELAYSRAIVQYNDYLEDNSPSIETERSIAECNIMIGDVDAALEWFSKIVTRKERLASDVLTYASLLKSSGDYSKAIIFFEEYSKMEPSHEEQAIAFINSCKIALEWIADPTWFLAINAEELNTENSDFGLSPIQNGYILTSDRFPSGSDRFSGEVYGWTGKPYLKLYSVSLDGSGNTITAPSAIGDLNSSYHNGPGSFDASSNTLWFTRTKMVKVTKKPVNGDPTSWYDNSTSENYINKLEIFSARYQHGDWVDIMPFEFNNPDQFSVGHPAITVDGELMYFVSDAAGGFGGTDIYYCEKLPNGQWSMPQNAGSAINTSGKELFPFVDDDGTLYFSSDGNQGMGGLDIFWSSGNRDNWAAPVNLRYPINSPKDDFSVCFTTPGTEGYLASNRDGGKGSDDIYKFVFAPPVNLTIICNTFQKLEDKSITQLGNVAVEVEKVSGIGDNTFYTDAEGQLVIPADCGAAYEIIGMKDGYFTSSAGLETSCITRNDTLYVDLILDKIIIDKPIVLDNIYYDYNKWNIRPDAAVELDKLVTILVNNPKISIELGSHTDPRGTNNYNQTLSQKRAESAVAYIISRGIDSNRITARGYGESVPVNSCVDGEICSEEEYQMNRRTEFKVTRITESK